MATLDVIELFAGIGAQSQALEELNIDHRIVAISEIDPYAETSYRAIHDPKVNNLGDITKIVSLPHCDLLTYSFPCTDISLAGKQAGLSKGSGTRSGLLWEVERLLEDYNKRGDLPKYLLLENVKNLVGKQFKADFDDWCLVLELLGYTNYWKVLNAKNYGIPQNRERVIMLSIKNDNGGGQNETYEWPEKIPLKTTLHDMLEEEVDEKFYINEDQLQRTFNSTYNKKRCRLQKKDWVGTLCAGDWKDPKLVQVGKAQKDNMVIERQVIEKRTDTGIREFKDNCCGTIRTTDSGGDKRAVEIAGVYTSASKDFQRPPLHGLSRTIKAVNHDAGIITEDLRVRKLTPRECWRLMGFTDAAFDRARTALIDKHYKGRDKANSQLYKQAGNSIVVDVLKAIFNNIKGLDHLR